MRISELEAHHDAFIESDRTIRAMVNNADFPAVLVVCIESFPHIVPAINFRKRREVTPEIPALLALTTICRYAPPLFEHSAIESLRQFIKTARVLLQSEKNLSHAADAARNGERVAHVLWNYLERHPGTLQRDIHSNLGVAQDDAVNTIEVWEELGIVERRPEGRSYRLDFRTHLDAEVAGLCPNCGVRGRGRKELLFRSARCQKCGTEGHYHIEYGKP
jgi:uncharacterized protein (DUF983 family)